MAQALTILQVTSSENRSGGTRQAMLLSRGLREAGQRVVFCAPAGSPALAWAQAEGFEARVTLTGGLKAQWRVSRILREVARQVDADVVHAHHTEGHNVAVLATFGGGFPPVVANRGVIFRPKFPAKFRSPRTAAIVTNSAAVKKVLEQSGVSGEKIHVVYNAKELPDRERLAALRGSLVAELGAGAGGPVIGAVGSGRPEKGFQF
ncbi:MAG: glycosyltransferase family 4 protein, partial [Proteobacteria bacterium]|nr:glycosyltransferase family 4 protein [Pseudomonadota bacterium]